MTQELEDYITHHLGSEPEYLAATFKETWRYRLYPRMCSGWTQGSFLAMLTSMVKPERVLELGTYSGYSAMAIASAMGPEASYTPLRLTRSMRNLSSGSSTVSPPRPHRATCGRCH